MSDCRSASPVIIASEITAAPALVPPTIAPASIARANHVGQPGALDRLHEPVLIAARHPDQRRPPSAAVAAPAVGERHFRASRAPASRHIFTDASPASGSADDCGSTATIALLAAGELERPRHDVRAGIPAADDDERA